MKLGLPPPPPSYLPSIIDTERQLETVCRCSETRLVQNRSVQSDVNILKKLQYMIIGSDCLNL